MTDPYEVSVSPRAERDLRGIAGAYSGALSKSTSTAMRTIFSTFDSLAHTPHRAVVFPQPPTRRPPVRSVPAWPYIVYFRVDDDERIVRITRVRHSARRPLRRFY